MNAAETIARCRELAAISDVEGGTTRTFLSPATRRAHALVMAWMRDAGLEVSTDAVGNLRGLRSAHSDAAGERGTLILGSHIDTVPDAGAFDGVLGVAMAIAVAKRLAEEPLPFALEVIAFSEEEGVRFGVPFLGSRALVGTVDEALLARVDARGVSVREAICAFGLDVKAIPAATIAGRVLGYLECHIEQGPVLEHEGLPLGVVETIAGQSRYGVRFEGEANHAGTTPMNLRHDAMAAAAEWIVEVERYASARPGLVATVGSVQALPGVGNAIAGEVRVTLDIRSPLDAMREDAADHLLRFAEACGEKRGVRTSVEARLQQAAVPLDDGLLRVLEDAVDATGVPVRRIVSGAGHDAMILASHMPAAMLFLRTPGGVSHHPAEAVLPGDVELGLDAALGFVRALAGREA